MIACSLEQSQVQVWSLQLEHLLNDEQSAESFSEQSTSVTNVVPQPSNSAFAKITIGPTKVDFEKGLLSFLLIVLVYNNSVSNQNRIRTIDNPYTIVNIKRCKF